MKYLALPCLAGTLLLSACHWHAAPPPQAKQTNNLNDQDLDGVITQRDKCLHTPHGAQVDNNGCSNQQTLSLIDPGIIYFNNDQHRIRGDQQAIISHAISRLQAQPSMTITLVGHTSAVASDSYNLALSKRRVEQVRQALLNAGISSDRIAATYRGEDELKHHGDSESVHQRNRRVEIRYHKKHSQPVLRWTINSLDGR